MLRPFGVDLLSTNQSESYNAILKLSKTNGDKPVSVMVLDLILDSEKYLSRIIRGRYRIGGEYTLRPDLEGLYDPRDPDAKLPMPTDLEKIKSNLQRLEEEEKKVVNLFSEIYLFFLHLYLFSKNSNFFVYHTHYYLLDGLQRESHCSRNIPSVRQKASQYPHRT
jgi:hypothetical protein